MLLNNLVKYEPGFNYQQGNAADGFFYLFDYDERSSVVNMEFQHQHNFYEICVFLDTAAGHIIEGNWFDIKFGDIVLIKPFLLHKTQYLKGSAQKRIIINFALPTESTALGGMYAHLLQMFEHEPCIFRFEHAERQEIFLRLNEVLSAALGKSPLKELYVHQKFIDFLSLIHVSQSRSIYKNKSGLDSITSKIYDITAYIHTNYQEPLSLTGLARKFFLSEYYLSHQFKKVTGFSLTDYIQMTRVRMAQKLLENTSRQILDIALSCGFFSFSQFSRVFKKHAGQSPTAYRAHPAERGAPSSY